MENVNARVGRVGENLSPCRFLEEASHPGVAVDDHDSELERVGDARQPDGDHRVSLLVCGDESRKVEVAEHVPREHQVVFGGDEIGAVRHGAGGAVVLIGVVVVQAHPEPLPVPEGGADLVRVVIGQEDGLVHAEAREVGEHTFEDRPVDDRQHGLRAVRRERPDPRAEAAGHHDRDHRAFPRQRRTACFSSLRSEDFTM